MEALLSPNTQQENDKIMQNIMCAPCPINWERVLNLQTALQNGSYSIQYERLAAKIFALEQAWLTQKAADIKDSE